MLTSMPKENVVEKIISIAKSGDVIPYKLINDFLKLENGDTMYNGALKPKGALDMQLRAAVASGNLEICLYDKTIAFEEEIYIKLLRILEENSSSLPSSSLNRERAYDNRLLNQFTITLARDDVPMDEKGDIPEAYQRMLKKLVDQKKASLAKEGKEIVFSDIKR